MKINFKVMALLGALFLAASSAHAHSVWIEDVKGKLVVRFGDFGGDLETSPGYLDDLSLPVAWTEGAGGTNKMLKIKTQSDRFALTGAKVSQSVFAQTDFDILSAPNKPGRWPIFYARWYVVGNGAAKPMLTFDLVPTGKTGELTVYFHNKPLPKATVTVTTPDGKENDFIADENGVVHFDATKPGIYFATSVHQRDSIAGFSRGKAYDLISHNCSLTWRQP